MRELDSKKSVIDAFGRHVSSGKAAFFKKYGIDFVPGRREGPFLYDEDGKRKVYNLHCNGGVFNLGHRHPEVVRALRDALDEVDIGNHHLLSRERAALARMMAGLMPGDLNVTIFNVSGGEAVDCALKIARGFTGRGGVISARGGYHGHTGLALAAGDEKYRAPFRSSLPGFRQVPFGDLESLAAALDRDTAAVILETVPATLGIVVPSREYLQGVRALCTERGALLVMDEVQTGLGRTGRLWAFEHFDILPDVVVLGKGLSGGVFPITATVIRDPLEAVFHDDPFIHVSTFGGAEVGCRVARRVLEISSAPAFLEKVRVLADRMASGLEKLRTRHRGFVLDVRRLGLMMGLRLKDEMCGPILTKTAFEHDLLMVYANNDSSVIQCLPPLVMEERDVGWIMKRLDGALAAAEKLRQLFGVTKGVSAAWKKLAGSGR